MKKRVGIDILKEILLEVKNKIPTTTSDLTNDSGFIDTTTKLVTQVLTSGTHIATINGTEIYAPTMTVTQVKTSGTHIATINGVKIYAP